MRMGESFRVTTEALSELAAQVAVELEPDGWQRRGRDTLLWGAFTKPLDDGLCATVEFRTASVSSDPWPLPLDVHVGVGYEPATALMPVVTLPWRVALIQRPVLPEADGPIRLAGPSDVARVSRLIASLAAADAVPYAATYASVMELDSALLHQPLPLPPHRRVQSRAVLLAASRRPEAARRVRRRRAT